MKKIAIPLGVILVAAAFLSAPHKQAEPKAASEQPSNIFSAAEVATHNNQEDCYAIVSGNVYNLTSWVGNHPGGAEAILGLCGKDGTAQFTGQHGSNAQAKQALAQFFIGTVKK